MNEETLRSITDRAKAGDKEAFAALYQATNPEIYHTILSMIRSEDQALDIQQEVYVHAFTHLNQLGDSGKLLPWLRAIAVNRCRTALRKQTPVLFTELEREDDSGIPELTDVRPGSLPEEALEQKETSRLIRETLDTLTDSQRLLVGMYYYEQLPISKIAEDLNLSPGTVKTQLSRSRKKLESRIKWLEARGVKLFGLAPMPFLMSLLRLQKPTAVGAEKALAGALSEAGISAESAAIHVGRRFFETALGKAVLGVAAVAAIGAGVAGWSWYQNRNQGNVGDVQTPETVHMAVYEDSNEDLHTAPETDPDPETDTVYVTLPDSEEDLPPEPETDSTEPTEPETDTEEPTDPATPSDPVRPIYPGNPVIVDPPESTDLPGPTIPGGSDQTDPTEPSVEPIQPAERSQVLSWRWKGDTFGSATDAGSEWDVDVVKYGKSGRQLVITVSGNDRPKLVSDRTDLINLVEPSSYKVVTYYSETFGTVSEYLWVLCPKDSGTAHVSCTLNGQTAFSMTVVIPEPQERYIQTKVIWKSSPGDTYHTIDHCYVGALYDFDVTVWGESMPEISTDHPEVIQLNPMKSYTDVWPNKGYYIQSRIVGAGDANVFIKLNGELKETIKVHASNKNDPGEDTASHVLTWNINGSQDDYMLIKGLHETLYIKVKGQETPTLYFDDPSIVSIDSNPIIVSNVSDNQVEYWFTLHALEEGSCTLYCTLNGETVFSITIRVQSEL